MANTTIVTSGTKGIGKATVLKILSKSEKTDKIIVNYGHDELAVEKMKKELSEEDWEKLFFIKADMSRYSEMEKFCEKISKITNSIDWVVLNTGIGTYVPYDEYTYDVWENLLRTNLSVPAFFIKSIKPAMNEKGNIVFVGSHAGQEPYSSSLAYSVSKAAVLFLAKSLVKQFDDKRVSVNAIAPGFIETEWQKGRKPESYERINKKIAAHRFGEPEEVAELIYSILINDYINGSSYDIHGGYNYY